jgi:hypothetical protein
MGRGDVAEIERRILPHQHDIDIVFQIERLPCAIGEMVAGMVAHLDRADLRADAAVGIAELRRSVVCAPAIAGTAKSAILAIANFKTNILSFIAILLVQ